MPSSVFDFKAINQRARELSSDIFGSVGDMMMDCPCCEEVFNPNIHDEYDKCNYCNGTHRKARKELERDGYLPVRDPDPPVNCVVCMDQGYQIKQRGLGNYYVPCGCPAGTRWAKSQSVQAQAAPAQSGCAQKAPTPKKSPWPSKF